MTLSREPLELALLDLRDRIDWPVGADLSTEVLARLKRPLRPRRRWLAPALAALALLVVLLISPPGREAIAWLLDIAGIRVEFEEVTVPTESPRVLVIGEEVSLAQAQVSVDFPVRLPGNLPAPDSIQIVSWGGAGKQAAFQWSASDRLPEMFDSGVGLLIVQFAATVSEELLTKNATEATTVEHVTVQGFPGYFLSGAPHTVFFEDRDEVIFEDSVRLAANVLIWEADGITYRIESALGLEETLEIAESLG